MGLGTIGGSVIMLWYDGVAPRLSAKHPTKHEEYLRLPLVCAGGPVYVASMLWLGWTAREDIHWFVPLSSMVPYGLSYRMSNSDLFINHSPFRLSREPFYPRNSSLACPDTSPVRNIQLTSLDRLDLRGHHQRT